jgi:hypothetical protein
MNNNRFWQPTRRQVLEGAAGLAALGLIGCEPDYVELGDPEIDARLWQTMVAYVRADGDMGGRLSLFNPSSVPQRVVLQAFTMDGTLVAHEEVSAAFPGGQSTHVELEDFLRRNDVSIPFEGSLWVGTAPQSGNVFMGLQGIVFDWYGPSHQASVHGMRDFGNANQDDSWSDLILPKVVRTERYVTHIAILNGSGDGTSEALAARPQVIIRDDDGAELVNTVLEVLAPYSCTLFAVDDLPGGDAIGTGTVQILEPDVGLVAMAFVLDRNNGGFASADHFFDRHFVVHASGFSD